MLRMAVRTHQSIASQQDTIGNDFFHLGEIRVATDSDFDYFIRLAEHHEEWIKKLDKNGLTVWQKEVGHSTIKMAKVSVDRDKPDIYHVYFRPMQYDTISHSLVHQTTPSWSGAQDYYVSHSD